MTEMHHPLADRIILPVPRYDMIALAYSFPSLRNAPVAKLERGQAYFDAPRLNRWVKTSPAVTAGSEEAGLFLLQVWDPGRKWSAGIFRVARALARWDDFHRRAFLAWAQDPWWP